MKEKLIDDFRNYLEKSRIKVVALKSDSSEVHIVISLLNYRIIIDIVLVLLAIYGTYKVEDKSFYLVPIILVYVILIIAFWIDFKPINRISINLATKKMEVQSRNIFKRIILKYVLKSQTEYDFNDIDLFSIRDNDAFKADDRRYFVEAQLKNQSKLTLAGFWNEEVANHLKFFLTNLINNKA